MAIVKAPALSMEASGNLGGICYSKWRSLMIARDPWTGTVPNTGLQVAQQTKLTGVAQDWGGALSSSDRERWKEAARTIIWTDRLGSPYIPSGYQYYMKLNIRRKVLGLALMNEPPGEQEKPYVEAFGVASQPAQVRIIMRLRLEVGISHDGYGTEYYKAGAFDSGGRSAIEGEWRFLDREVPPSSYIDLDVIANKWYWYRARTITEFGDTGNWWEIQKQFA